MNGPNNQPGRRGCSFARSRRRPGELTLKACRFNGVSGQLRLKPGLCWSSMQADCGGNAAALHTNAAQTNRQAVGPSQEVIDFCKSASTAGTHRSQQQLLLVAGAVQPAAGASAAGLDSRLPATLSQRRLRAHCPHPAATSPPFRRHLIASAACYPDLSPLCVTHPGRTAV